MSYLSVLLVSWEWDLRIVIALIVGVLLYIVGWTKLRSRARIEPPSRLQLCSYLLGTGAVAIALLSPLEVYSDQLFSVHMVEHIFLLEVAPPLIWASRPILPLLWSLPYSARRILPRFFRPKTRIRALFHFVTSPVVTATVYIFVVGVWHLPALYDSAQGEGIVHYLEHAMFLASGLLFWWPVLHPASGRRRLGRVAVVPYILLAAAEGGLLGGLFTFYDHVVYVVYADPHNPFGLTPLLDQQLGGIVMWAFGG